MKEKGKFPNPKIYEISKNKMKHKEQLPVILGYCDCFVSSGIKINRSTIEKDESFALWLKIIGIK